MLLCSTSSSGSGLDITASTSEFTAVHRPDLFLLHDFCSPIGRGIPDISAQALKFEFILNGNPKSFSGTSCLALVRVLLPQLCSICPQELNCPLIYRLWLA